MTRQLDEVLADVPFFSGMRAETVALLSGCAHNVHFSAGEVLFREGEPSDTFYVVRHGTVGIETFAPARGSVPIESIQAGDVVGWSWLFPPNRWQFDGRALTDVRATAFDGACVRTKCESDPVLGYDLTKRFARVLMQRLAWTRIRLLDIYGQRGS